MTRLTVRLSLVAGLCLMAASPPAASASPPPPKSSDAVPTLELRAPTSIAHDVTMTKIEVVAGVTVVEISQRTRDGLQTTRFDSVVVAIARNPNADNPFDRDIVSGLLDEHGSDVVRLVFRRLCRSADSYRPVLRLINDVERTRDTQRSQHVRL